MTATTFGHAEDATWWTRRRQRFAVSVFALVAFAVAFLGF